MYSHDSSRVKTPLKVQLVLRNFRQRPAPPSPAHQGGRIGCKTTPPEWPNQLPHPPRGGSAGAKNRLSLEMEMCFDTAPYYYYLTGKLVDYSGSRSALEMLKGD
jgi:hypothetical protein